jgi:hypothetical protein
MPPSCPIPAPRRGRRPRRRPGRVPGHGVVRLRPEAARPARHQLHGRAGPVRRPRRAHRQRQELDHQPRLEVLPADQGEILRSTAARSGRSPAARSTADGHGAAAELPLQRHGPRQHPPQPAGGHRGGGARPPPARLPDILEALPQGLHTRSASGAPACRSGQRQLVCFCPRAARRSADRDPGRGDQLDRRADRGRLQKALVTLLRGARASSSRTG